MYPLGCFQEIGDYLRDREVTLALKDATAAWLSLAQVIKQFFSTHVEALEVLKVLVFFIN
jgi:hypothetical protein